ncbi:MAG: DUF1501 domain-containing protein [Planctomycetes bacterium]|nr:DUF1501 domain-containing protein [Planctomycetota bacterium]
MIEVGSFLSGSCEGISRRAFLKAGLSVPLALGVPAPARSQTKQASPAKSVMLIWLGGGPSHLDLFDPKPLAPQQYRGPFGTIQTRIPGVHFTELLPKLAARSDRFSVIRSNINYHGGHREAGSIAMTGTVASDGGEGGSGTPASYGPHFGAILARQRGAGELPGFISLARGPIGDGVGPNFGQGGGKWVRLVSTVFS